MSWIIRMRRLPCLAVLAPAIIRNAGHRAGPVQRNRGDQVLEPVRTHLAQRVAHALAFHLEHPAGIAARQHLVGLRVVQRQAVEIDRRCPARAAAPSARSQDGERGQAEEVELHQSRLLDMLHRILRDQEIRARIAIQRHQFDQRPVADHHAGGVRAGMAVQTLDLQRDLQQPRNAFVLVAHHAAAVARRRSPAAGSPDGPDCSGSVRRPCSPGRTAARARAPRRAPRRAPAACRR